MDELLELVKGLDDEQKKIFYKYLRVIKVCSDNFTEKFNFIKEKGFKLDKARGIIRLLELDLDELKNKFSIYEAANLSDMVINYPELLRYNAKKVIDRIKTCEEVGKGYKTDNGEYLGFLFNDAEWIEVSEGIKDTPQNEANNDEFIANIIEYNEPVELDAEDFEKYLKVAELVGSAREAILGKNKDDENAKVSSDVLITKLIRTNGDLTPKEITKAVLKYCNNITEGVDDILDTLSEGQEEKRGL